MRQEAKVNKREGLVKSGVKFGSVFIPLRTRVIHFQLQTEWSLWVARYHSTHPTQELRNTSVFCITTKSQN